MPKRFDSSDVAHMTEAIELARIGWGFTSPNPCVGAVLVKKGEVIGRGWHRQAGKPHAEMEAVRDAERKGKFVRGATMYVTLEPCSTTGRTPPCCDAIVAAKVKRVVIATMDPNPKHAGRGVGILRKAGLKVDVGLMANESNELNEAFNHWIVHRTPFVTVKSAMTLDGKIATATGESKWITKPTARTHAMNHLRRPADGILVGINTVIADNPSLTYRGVGHVRKKWRRIVLDTNARTPLKSQLVVDEHAELTLIIVGDDAPARKVNALSRKVEVWRQPTRNGRIDLRKLLRRLGREQITSLLVEGGGEVNGQFLGQRLAHRVTFYFAPKILGGRGSICGIAGDDPFRMAKALDVEDLSCENVGADLFLSGRLKG